MAVKRKGSKPHRKGKGLPCGFTRTKTIAGQRYNYAGMESKKNDAVGECNSVKERNHKNKCRVVPKKCVGYQSKKNKLVNKTVYGVYVKMSRGKQKSKRAVTLM
jgi:hypothetical protein